eukprot:8658385-Pyramimonas_sp.AAC.1
MLTFLTEDNTEVPNALAGDTCHRRPPGRAADISNSVFGSTCRLFRGGQCRTTPARARVTKSA